MLKARLGDSGEVGDNLLGVLRLTGTRLAAKCKLSVTVQLVRS